VHELIVLTEESHGSLKTVLLFRSCGLTFTVLLICMFHSFKRYVVIVDASRPSDGARPTEDTNWSSPYADRNVSHSTVYSTSGKGSLNGCSLFTSRKMIIVIVLLILPDVD